MAWQGLVSLWIFLGLTVLVPLVVALVIVWRDITDDSWDERAARHRDVVLRGPAASGRGPTRPG